MSRILNKLNQVSEIRKMSSGALASAAPVARELPLKEKRPRPGLFLMSQAFLTGYVIVLAFLTVLLSLRLLNIITQKGGTSGPFYDGAYSMENRAQKKVAFVFGSQNKFH